MDVTGTIHPADTLAEHKAKPLRTEAEARAKREADYIAREAIRLEQMQLNRLLGGLK